MPRIGLAISLLALALVLLAAPAGALVIINNGLAPPNPANVIDSRIQDEVRVQNVGCDSIVTNPCPMPWGDPTSVELVSGGSVADDLHAFESSTLTMSGGSVGRFLFARDSSTLTMSGGSVGGELQARDSSKVTMSGGSVGDNLGAFESSTLTVSGGTVGILVVASDSSTLTIVGTDFAVDGDPVDYGPIAASSGVLTGTLESGELIDNFFCHDGSTACGFATNGLITLPEPDQALLFAAAMLSLAAMRGRVQIPG
jgi:hypothetical protein